MPLLCRLDKFLVSQGVCSRSEAGRLCRRGQLTVDGVSARDPAQKIDPDTAAVALNGRMLTYKRQLYVMMNKPAGVLSASRDPHTKTVIDLLPPALSRRGLFPAGRLDKDTTGFVCITDDGEFAHQILAPKSHVPKRYQVRLSAPLAPELPARFAEGLILPDETACAPSKLLLLEDGEQPLWEITITEGKYHQIKRMFGAFHYNVCALHRVAIGKMLLDPTLPPGGCRELTAAETAAMRESYDIFCECCLYENLP